MFPDVLNIFGYYISVGCMCDIGNFLAYELLACNVHLHLEKMRNVCSRSDCLGQT